MERMTHEIGRSFRSFMCRRWWLIISEMWFEFQQMKNCGEGWLSVAMTVSRCTGLQIKIIGCILSELRTSWQKVWFVRRSGADPRRIQFRNPIILLHSVEGSLTSGRCKASLQKSKLYGEAIYKSLCLLSEKKGPLRLKFWEKQN